MCFGTFLGFPIVSGIRWNLNQGSAFSIYMIRQESSKRGTGSRTLQTQTDRILLKIARSRSLVELNTNCITKVPNAVVPSLDHNDFDSEKT